MKVRELIEWLSQASGDDPVLCWDENVGGNTNLETDRLEYYEPKGGKSSVIIGYRKRLHKPFQIAGEWWSMECRIAPEFGLN